MSSVSALKGKKHPPNFHKVQLSSQDPHEWRRSTFTEAALTCTQLETRSVSRVFSISRKQAAKSKSQQKKVIVKVPSYTKVIVIIIVAVFPGSKYRFFNPNRFFPVVARFLPPFSPHLTWFWVMKCDRLLAQQLGRITSSGWIFLTSWKVNGSSIILDYFITLGDVKNWITILVIIMMDNPFTYWITILVIIDDPFTKWNKSAPNIASSGTSISWSLKNSQQ